MTILFCIFAGALLGVLVYPTIEHFVERILDIQENFWRSRK